MYLTMKCAISGKDIRENDNVVAFPYFDASPGDPEFICCENVALRSEFESWYLKNRVVEKVRDFWIWQYHHGKSFSILAENENILISKSNIEDSIRLFFLKYVFYVWFTETAWKRLKDLVTVENGHIDIYKDEGFSWTVDSTRGIVLLQRIEVRKGDAVVIPITEWQDFQELLSANI